MTMVKTHHTFIALLVIVAVLSALTPALFGAYWTLVVLNLMMWVALTQSWVLFCGLTGYVSLGHVVFYGIGAYVAVVSFKTLPLWCSVPLAGVVSGLFALIVAMPVLRVRGPYFVILTFGLAELVKYCVLNLETTLGKSSRLMFGAPSATTLLYAMIVLAVAASVTTLWCVSSRFGRGLVAIREDETTAQTIGIPVNRYKTLAFALSAVIPGMVGALMSMRSTYFEVLQVFNPEVSFTIVTMAIIGGSSDARGPLLGAVFFVALSELLWTNAPRLYMIILGALLIIFVLRAPNGLVGWIKARSQASRSLS